MANTKKVERKCGLRKPGKIYFTLNQEQLDDYGIPWEIFVLDPTLPIGDLTISAQGVTVLPSILGYDSNMNPIYQRNSKGVIVYHAYDWVGSEYTVKTFWEELQEKGLSRLNPKNTKFDVLCDESMYILVFPKGAYNDPPSVECPFGKHHQDFETCFGNLLEGDGDYPARVFQFPIHIGGWAVVKDNDDNVTQQALDILQDLQVGIGRVGVVDY